MQARLLHPDQVRLPPTQEIASENVFLVPRSLGIGDIDAAAILDLILKADALLVCPCALADNRRACLRQQWVSRLPRQPRTRARRRQRRSGGDGSGERDDGSGSGDSDGGGGGEPPPQRLIAVAPSDRDREPLAGGAS